MAVGDIDITVLITCFNEQASIVPTIEDISRALDRADLNAEIIVTDDASQDDSIELVRRYQDEHPGVNIRLNRHEVNRGLVFGVFEGARLGRGHYYWAVAGDNNVTEETALTLLRNVGKADIVVPEVMRVAGRSLFRNLLSVAYASLVRIISGCPIRYFNGSSIYRRQDLVATEHNIMGFSYAADSILQLIDRGRTYIEVPVVYRERTHGSSSAVSLRNFRAVSRFLFKLLWRRAMRLFQSQPAHAPASVKAEAASD